MLVQGGLSRSKGRGFNYGRQNALKLRAQRVSSRSTKATGTLTRTACLKSEAKQFGKINIQDGTKGGRSGASAPRWITVDDHIRDVLSFAEKVLPDGSRNLLAPNERYP
ncbi:hypothetical protein FBY09_14533 [Pseudomonas sp. SJZ101]|nr:hypothetical protein FBY00_14633 [Pseudomonas sp. SJZ075]TWC26713.1 hypothetical protein FBY02_14733 [Pseudomonas sp. SJZ078]TWC45830.1 hypothetical protein FBY11_1461 [Pseudomonas sp. SJZ124]TWC81155.1 hypothetical protein FBY09_14533 [Pseudomonas sp. SJZ101]